MSDAVRDTIAAEIALLVAEVATPVAPFGYGTDLRCTTDVTPDLQEVDPNSPEAIGEATFRRWTTPRGQNPDDAEYGRSLIELLNRGMTQTDMLAEAGLLRGEAEKDDRVEDCVVTITATNGGRDLRISARVTPADPAIAAFSMTVAVVNGVALLEAITP